MSARRLLTAYGVWMAMLVISYFLFPTHKIILWSAIGASSAAAVVVGTIRNRPRQRLPWLLVALGLLVFTAGDTVWLLLTEVWGEPNPYPSPADVLYLAMYPLLLAVLILLPRSSTGRDRAGIVDALVLTAGLGLLAWIFLIRPYVEVEGLTTLQRLTSIAYPLWDILLLAAGAAIVSALRRTPAVVLLAIGLVFLLATDVVYGLSQLQEDWQMGGPIDFGWIVFYATWGAAALHPSMVSLTEPRVIRHSDVTGTRLVVLTLSALIAPAVLFVETATTGTAHDAIAIAVLSAAIFLLVLVRLAGVVRRHRRAVGRERGLREAGAALLSATDVDAVRTALETTIRRLLRPGARHRLRLELRGEPAHPAAATPGRAHFVRTSELAAGPTLGGFDLALVTPLMIEDRPAGEPYIGTLTLAADDPTLEALQPAMEVLAAQAALAIERISLSTEIARRNSEEYFRTLVHNTADVILIVSDDNKIRYASPSATTMFGDAPLAGRPIRSLIYPTHRESAWRVLERVRSGQEEEATADWSVLGGSGELVEVEASCRDLRADPTVHGLVLTLRDVTEPRRLERELKHRAYHDSLTGLPNRVLFSEQVQQAVNRARRADGIVGVLFIDLDDFRVVNDTMGHDAGDQLLMRVGQRLRDVQRASDSAARLGGDEFAVLIEEATDALDVEQVAERIVRTLAQPIRIEGSVLNPSASVGVATTIDAPGAADLLRQADLALYVAKGAGKGRWRRYQSALHTAMVERLALRAALDQAVAAGDFVLQYQPIVSLVDGSTAGFEALVRWRHATRGLIAPGDFIDVAEDSGLIIPIGNWVLHQALTDAATWSDGGQPPYISVNVSVRQFRASGFIDSVRQHLATTGMPPHRLMLEITESLLLRDDEQVWSDLTTLRQLGVQVAIDDFGTGYSSLSYLRQVPIDVVKIDKSFVDTLRSAPEQRALVEGIVRLAHTLGLQVIAEGIERSGDRDTLRRMGCPFGQGFLFARPMDANHVLGWLHPDRIAA